MIDGQRIETVNVQFKELLEAFPDINDICRDDSILTSIHAAQISTDYLVEHVQEGNSGGVLVQATALLGAASKIVQAFEDRMDKATAEAHQRAEPLLGQCAVRIMEIDKEIRREERGLALREARDKEEFDRLSKAGLTPLQANAIASPITDEERAAIEARIDTLNAERGKVGRFMDDAPRFDPALLGGTKVEVAERGATPPPTGPTKTLMETMLDRTLRLDEAASGLSEKPRQPRT